MPSGLDIEREQSLSGSMPSYAEQLVICSGKSDWKSRIEDEPGADGDLVRSMKGLLGLGGKLRDVCSHNYPFILEAIRPSVT